MQRSAEMLGDCPLSTYTHGVLLLLPPQTSAVERCQITNLNCHTAHLVAAAAAAAAAAGIRRVEVPGDRPELSYPRDRSQRFTDELVSQDGKIFKYR
jgi:hypothetical protein